MASPASTGSYRPWFERWPELVEWERRRFEHHGLPWAIDERAKAHGYLVVDSEVEYEGRPVPIRVVYPSETPELPPLIYAEETILERHQQPFAGNFCLLERPEDDWNARDWGAADLIDGQLKALLRDSEAGEAVVRAAEAPVPEPRTAMYQYAPGSVILVPGDLAAPEGEGGSFALRPFDVKRFVLSEVDGRGGDPRVVDRFRTGGEVRGAWRRVDQAPLAGPDGQAILRWLDEEHPDLVRFPPRPSPRGGRRGQPEITTKYVGLVFSEEAEPGGRERQSWLFLEVERSGAAALLHAQVTSEEERGRRIPGLRDLRERKVTIVGMGSLGGELAVQLARAGVGELHLIDHDRFEVNNAVRHVLGVDQSGRSKVHAVAEACTRANPFCNLIGDPDLHLGSPAPVPPLQRLHAAVADADLVVDTTGVNQLQLVVGRVAWELGKPVVLCWLTDGSWAGEVARLTPGSTACGACFLARQVRHEGLAGEADPDAAVFPQGCAHPTTSGAGFEASEVVANAARLVTSMLSDGYPEIEWDHAVMNFRRTPDDPVHRRFDAEFLEPSDDCEFCGSRLAVS